MNPKAPKCFECNKPMHEIIGNLGIWHCRPCKIYWDEDDMIDPDIVIEKPKEVRKVAKRKPKSINLNDCAVRIAKREGGKIQLPIGQIKECMKLAFQELASISEEECMKVVRRYKKK